MLYIAVIFSSNNFASSSRDRRTKAQLTHSFGSTSVNEGEDETSETDSTVKSTSRVVRCFTCLPGRIPPS